MRFPRLFRYFGDKFNGFFRQFVAFGGHAPFFVATFLNFC
uniref:Uncharacterized protein n=1 Tax=Siphoviridae sp. ctLeG9 TaxID=2827848 RepID=A0A8S5RV52_9CAUD|nr:MAG TPA: hypothetical protein [Siphoviridae sp. ctLeG9]